MVKCFLSFYPKGFWYCDEMWHVFVRFLHSSKFVPKWDHFDCFSPSFRMTKMPFTWLTWATSWRSTSAGRAFYPASNRSMQWSATTPGLSSRRWRLWELDSTVRARYAATSSSRFLKSQMWLLHVSQWSHDLTVSLSSIFNPVLTRPLILLSTARRRSRWWSLWVWIPAGSSMPTPASSCLRSNMPPLKECRWWRLTVKWSSWRWREAMIVPSE